ncbi:hypothetical protein AB6A40_004904 [Gnathostoma spinigerum]|uniref:Annexin n=1 Tax=Gnathostoma spinigerum TaxID=75299 RepID=A0ABD6EPL2_9BILA
METLAEILCSKQNDEMIALNNQYESEYGVTLKSAIIEATKGRIRDLLTSVVDDQREKPIDVDNSKAQEDARRLLSRHDDEGRHIDQYVLYRLLSTCNKQQLIRTFKNYERMCNMDVESAIQKDCEGGERIVYLSLVQCTTNKPRFFAMRLNEALKTLKANTNELVRILISRSEIDLKLIQQEYYKLFGKDLTEEVASKTDGPHRSTLTAIVRGNYRGF